MNGRKLGLGVACALVASLGGGTSHAIGIAGDTHAIEQRIALSIGPQRTTLWSQMRVSGAAGTFAIVVPARPGASLDWATDAWLEALQAASAPRILPNPDTDATCPDETAVDDPVHVAGMLAHTSPLVPIGGVEVLDDAAAVSSWAGSHGLTLRATTFGALSNMTDHRFVVARFDAPAGDAWTPTLRVTGPDALPSVPLLLSHAGASSTVVTMWILGEGRARANPGTEIAITDLELGYDVATGDWDYAAVIINRLAASGNDAMLVELANPGVLVDRWSAGPTHDVPSLISDYAARAAAYESDVDADACANRLQQALLSTNVVAPSCAPAALGVVEGMATCDEVTGPGDLDPESLRCGDSADDFAVGLSGIAPNNAWLTRVTTRVPPNSMGLSPRFDVGPGVEAKPIAVASDNDISGCEDGSGGAGGEGGSVHRRHQQRRGQPPGGVAGQAVRGEADHRSGEQRILL